MLELGIVPGAAFKSALVGVKLMYDPLPAGGSHSRALIQRKTRGPRINHLLFTAPAFFDFNTFNAREINGSMPLSISVFLLSNLMSTGTPLPS